MAPMSLAEQSVDNTVGAILLGVIGAAFLYGITTLQTYTYFHHYPHDTMLHKVAVSVLWALDSTHLMMSIHAVYWYAVGGFGDKDRLMFIPWSIKLQISINVVIILLVHSLYAQRVWKLGGYHRGVLGYVVASVVAGGAVIGIVLAYVVYTSHTFNDIERMAWVIYAALGASTTIDFVIAAAMCYYLRKSKGSITRLNSRISTIMQYSLGSGLFTSAFSLLSMFSYILLPNTLVFLAVEFLVTKFYVGSFLTMLNARERIRRGASTSPVFEGSLDPAWKRNKTGTTSSFGSPGPLTVELPPTPEVVAAVAHSPAPMRYPWQ